MPEASPTLSRAQLRSLCDHDAASPRSRLDAAAQLLQEYGASDRNLRIIRRTIRRFERFTADSPRTQQQTRWWAERLKGKLERMLEANPVQPEDADESEADATLPEDEPSTPTRKPIVANLDLLPVDGDDEFWDELIGGQSRRELFLMSWSLDPALSRGEIIDAIGADPARLESRTLRLQLWACSKEQLDQKFEADGELIRAELTARGFEDTDDRREELVRQILASGEPLLRFEKPTPAHDFNGSGLPVLVRSKAGLLLDAINFTATWPDIRLRHQAL